MRGFTSIIVASLGFVNCTLGSMWVSPVGSDGIVTRPASYLQAIDGCTMGSRDLSRFQQGDDVNGVNLGGLALQALPFGTSIFAQSGPVTQPFPILRPMALYVDGAAGQPSTVIMTMLEPTTSCSFLLMGMASNVSVVVYDTNQQVFGQYVVPDISDTGSMWIGLSDAARLMLDVRLTPWSAGDFALADIEVGVHHPEPSTAGLFLLAAACGVLRRHRGAAV